MGKEMWMDDVGSLTTKTVNYLQEELQKEFGQKLDDQAEDRVFDAIWKELENKSNGNYRNEN
jgi:hypothetical protein